MDDCYGWVTFIYTLALRVVKKVRAILVFCDGQAGKGKMDID